MSADNQLDKSRRGSGALMIATGILLSRCMGLVRERVFAHYFGSGATADAFKAALRIPNILQNLLGEGALSASFIPAYSKLQASSNVQEARLVAANTLAMIVVLTGGLSALGIYFAPELVQVLAPGFLEDRREITVELTKIFFCSVFLLVCSAWCLGILNSHKRFFLPYASPVIWNLVIIVGILFFARDSSVDSLAVKVAWCVVLGSAAQVAVQLPTTWRLLGGIRVTLSPVSSESKSVARSFVPVVISRGVMQISAYIDSIIASLLQTGAVATLSYAQTISLLPGSLFGISVSAAELPALSALSGDGNSSVLSADEAISVQQRVVKALRQISFFIVPSAVALIILGDIIARVLYEGGKFTAADTNYVWFVLIPSGIGLLASSLSRLTSTCFFAMKDTRTPYRYSLIRVSLSITLGLYFSLKLPLLLGVGSSWGLVGLTGASAIAGWVEYVLLKLRLRQIIGDYQIGRRFLVTIWTIAICSGGLFRLLVSNYLDDLLGGLVAGIVGLSGYGCLYFMLSLWLRIPEAKVSFRRSRGGV